MPLLIKSIREKTKREENGFDEVKILWGEHPENDAELKTYKFKTIAERDAFKQGIRKLVVGMTTKLFPKREYREWKEFKELGYTNQ